MGGSESSTSQRTTKPSRWCTRLFRRKRWLLWLLALLLLPWLWILVFTPAPGAVATPKIAERSYGVWALLEGRHAGILIERPVEWPLGQQETPLAPYVEYGWGDRRFYKDSRRSPDVIVRAVLLPSDSVTYVRSLWSLPAPVKNERRLFRGSLDAAAMTRLIRELEASIQRMPDGRRVDSHPKVERFAGRFYPGRESYIFWSSCNTWVVERLATVGLASSATGVIFAFQLPGRLRGMVERK